MCENERPYILLVATGYHLPCHGSSYNVTQRAVGFCRTILRYRIIPGRLVHDCLAVSAPQQTEAVNWAQTDSINRGSASSLQPFSPHVQLLFAYFVTSATFGYDASRPSSYLLSSTIFYLQPVCLTQEFWRLVDHTSSKSFHRASENGRE
jgi:hypothetical protein